MTGLEFPEAFEPPGKSGGTPAAPPRDRAPKPTPAGRATSLEKRLHEAIGSIGIAVALLNEVDGLAIIEGAERLAGALDKAAKQNPSVKRTLEAALTGGVWAEVTFASGAILLPIAANHGLFPKSMFQSVFGSQNGGNPAHTDEPPNS